MENFQQKKRETEAKQRNKAYMFALHDFKDQFVSLVHGLETQPVLLVLILFLEFDNVTILILEPKPLIDIIISINIVIIND